MQLCTENGIFVSVNKCKYNIAWYNIIVEVTKVAQEKPLIFFIEIKPIVEYLFSSVIIGHKCHVLSFYSIVSEL